MRGAVHTAGFEARAPLRDRVAAMSGLPGWLFILATLLLFTVSGGMLWLVGINYEGLTGSPVSKIHPGTYIVVLVFVWVACEGGNPVALMAEMAQRRPACLLMLVSAAVFFLQVVLKKAPGMAGAIDTYMLPPLVVVLFMKSGAEVRRRLEAVIHGALLANALLGLVEFATKHLYFPYRFDGDVYKEDTRATALQGHPLGSASITAVYVLALLCGGGRLSTPQRLVMVVLQLAAMVAFGGRVALVTTLALGGAVCLAGAHRHLRSGRVPILGVAAAVMALTIVPLLIAGLYTGGFFDALLTRFETDGGSANARIEMLNLIAAVPLRDLVVGPDIGFVESLRRMNGLELGIENPIVKMVLYQGAVVTALMILSTGLFLYELVRWSRSGLVVPVIAFVIIINTFESIASKSTMLAKFALMMLVLFRPVTRSARADAPVPSKPAPRGALRPPRLTRGPNAAFDG